MTEESRKVGRPTKYKEEYAELAYKFSLLGAIDAQLAQLLEISESTLNNWKREHPEFLESIKKGKEIAGVEVVEAMSTNFKSPCCSRTFLLPKAL